MATDYFRRKLDDKRRLTIPTELRSEFSSGVVVTRGFGKSLHLYSKQVWEQKMEPALKGNILDERTAELNVAFRRGKTEAELDQKQGRILLEQHLLDFSNITKDVDCTRAGDFWQLVRSED